MIQAGSDWTACSELANATRDEVTEAVTDKQDMLDGLDKGCDCAGKGQDEVNRTLNEMNAAFTAVTDAETALETATNAQVQLADQEFSFLQAGECGWIMTDAAYLSAYAIYTKAVNTLAKAKTTYNLSVTAHTEAVTEAARLKLECECATQSAHATAWADANQDNDANAAAWAQAHHIDCVVDHISEADCSFGPAPGLTQPTLCDDIESVSCATESGSAAAPVGSAAAPVGSADWVMSKYGENCNAACSRMTGATCDPDAMRALVLEADFAAAFIEAGATCTAYDPWDYEIGPTQCTNNCGVNQGACCIWRGVNRMKNLEQVGCIDGEAEPKSAERNHQ